MLGYGLLWIIWIVFAHNHQTFTTASPIRKLPEFVLEISFQNQTRKLYAYQGEVSNLSGVSGLNQNDTASEIKEYNARGAMLFAVAVILIYGVSIALLIGTTLRPHDDTDYEVKGFLRTYARLDKTKRSSEKLKTRNVLLERNLLPMLPGISFAATPNILKNEKSKMAASRGISLHNLATLTEEVGSTGNQVPTSAALSDPPLICGDDQPKYSETQFVSCHTPLMFETEMQQLGS